MKSIVFAVIQTVLLTGLLVQCSSQKATSTPDGGKAYAKTCAVCHGDHGQGYVADQATQLSNQTFLASASADFLARSISRGRPGTTMSAWDTAHMGPWGESYIQAIGQYIQTWRTVPAVEVDGVVVQGDPKHGQDLYNANCASCHGATGQEGPEVRVANPEFLSTATDGFLQYAIANGRPGTKMNGFMGTLAAQDVNDIVALLRSWAIPPPSTSGDIPLPGVFGNYVQNVGGPEPNFPSDSVTNRFTPADTVKSELDRGAKMVFIDARAPSDYASAHVKGAINVPFYDVDNYWDALPEDIWLVLYCACPHAESGQLQSGLFGYGLKKVTVIDEGFAAWTTKSYPIDKGGTP